jgi:ferric-dicitrate binding protein FerR (iron transport regulator)
VSDRPPLDPDDEVSQYGLVKASGPDFKLVPQADQETLSLIHGRVDVGRAAQLVQRRKARRRDAVRYSTVAKLEAEGFVVIQAPLDWFEEHLEVQLEVVWDDKQGERFDSCFSQPMVWSA